MAAKACENVWQETLGPTQLRFKIHCHHYKSRLRGENRDVRKIGDVEYTMGPFLFTSPFFMDHNKVHTGKFFGYVFSKNPTDFKMTVNLSNNHTKDFR